MPELTTKQQELFEQLRQAIAERKDITGLLKEMSREDFLSVLREKFTNNDDDVTLLGYAAITAFHLDAMKTILNMAKEKGVLKEIVTGEIRSFKEGECKKYYLFTDLLTHPKCKAPSEILNDIEESCGLEDFWKVISKNDRTNIKAKLANENGDRAKSTAEDQKMLDEIHQIEKSMAFDKAKKVGVTCIAISTLAFGIGCFAVSVGYLAVGVTLPIFSMAGIAMAATLVAGLAAGVITYAVSKPSNEVKEANIQQKKEDIELKSIC